VVSGEASQSPLGVSRSLGVFDCYTLYRQTGVSMIDQAKRDLNAKLMEGLEELERGECAEMTEEEWAEIRREVEVSFMSTSNDSRSDSGPLP
jgi:hypothetical protein